MCCQFLDGSRSRGLHQTQALLVNVLRYITYDVLQGILKWDTLSSHIIIIKDQIGNRVNDVKTWGVAVVNSLFYRFNFYFKFTIVILYKFYYYCVR